MTREFDLVLEVFIVDLVNPPGVVPGAVPDAAAGRVHAVRAADQLRAAPVPQARGAGARRRRAVPLPAGLSVCLCVCLCVCLSVGLPVCLSVLLSVSFWCICLFA